MVKANLDKVITYSGTTITCTGGTQDDPITFWDLWNASYVNGWNVVDQLSSNATIGIGLQNTSYVINANIRIGKDIVPPFPPTPVDGHLGDEDVTVIFPDGINHRAIWLMHGTFRLGKLEDATNKITSGGVTLIFLDDGSGQGLIENDDNAYFYASTFLAPNVLHHYFKFDAQVRMYECSIANLYLYYSAIPDIYRLEARGGNIAINPTISGGTFEDILCHSLREIFYLSGSQSGQVSDVVGKNNTYVARLNDWTGTFNLTNSEADNWTFHWTGTDTGQCYRQYMLDLTVQYPNGTAIENTNVTIINDYLGISDSWLTDADGNIPEQTYSMGHYNQTGENTIYDYNPYNITITYPDYQTYTTLFNITQKEDLTITLTPEVPPPEPQPNRFAVGLACGLGILLSLIFVGWVKVKF